MSQVQLEAFFLVQSACTAFPSTLVSMLELSPPLPILLLLRVAGLSGLNTIIVLGLDVMVLRLIYAFLWNADNDLLDCTASHCRRLVKLTITLS
jgi:hypothetical protein